MAGKRKKQSKRGTLPPNNPQTRRKGGRKGGRRGGDSNRKASGGKNWVDLDFIPLRSEFLSGGPSISPRSKEKPKRMSGKRVLREERSALRFQPVEFVLADETYDPSVVIQKMMHDSVEGEVDPEVLMLENDERENEVRMQQMEDTESTGILSPHEIPAVSELETGYSPDSSGCEDTDHLWDLSEAAQVDFENSLDEIHLDSMSLGSDTTEEYTEDDQNGVADLSSNGEVNDIDENDYSEIETKDANLEKSDADFMELTDSSGGSGDESSDSDVDNFEDADIDLLQRFAMRDFDGHASDIFDDYDDMDSEEADDLIQQLIGGMADFSSYEVPNTSKRKGMKTSSKRKERKKARELERLTNFGKDPELWQKYPETISVQEVLQEINDFVLSEYSQEIRFPPLDHNANYYVKEIAKLHGLATFMQGRATLKCVVAARTSRTGPVRDFARLRSLISRRQSFSRVDLNIRKDRSRKKDARPSARVRDGEIVGHQAESISSGSIGHKLMKLMGWEEGTGLGTNKAGITAPISAKVKLTKVGIVATQERAASSGV